MRDFCGEIRLYGADDNILSALTPTAAFVEHAKTLAHAGRVTQKDLQSRSGLLVFIDLGVMQELIRGRLSFDSRWHNSIISQNGLLLSQ